MHVIKDFLEAGRLLNEPGTIGVIPTDTVYGVAARAVDEGAIKKFYELKQRQQKPGTLIAANIEQLVALGIPRRYLTPVMHYWPNPLSIIIPTTPELRYLDTGKGSLAIRIPSHQQLYQLLCSTGPLMTSSANQPGRPPATTITEAQHYFADQVHFYLDGGQLQALPSTIIQVIDDAVEVIRAGTIKINDKGEIAS